MADLPTSKLKKKEQIGYWIITLTILGILAATGIYFWGLIVPFLLDAATNTLKLVGVLAALGAVLYMAFDPRIRTLLLYGYNSFTRWLTSEFVEIDPIGILSTYVKRLAERVEEMDEAIGHLKGQRAALKEKIGKNEGEWKHEMQLAQQAQKRGAEMRGELTLHANQAGRLKKSTMTLQGMLDQLEALLATMTKMREAAFLMQQDIKNEVAIKTDERKMIMASYKAYRAGKAVIEGNASEKELFDLTMEKLADDYAQKMGEIEQFMDASKGFINGVDLDKGIYEEEALQQLKAWEEKGSTLLTKPANGNGVPLRVDTSGLTAPANVRISEAEEASPDSFSDLLNKKA
jgi:hypothetical protein